MIVNVTKKRNSPVLKINHGDVLNVYRKNGYAMVIRIVLMEPMKTLRYIIVRHLNHVAKICLHAKMDDVSIK